MSAYELEAWKWGDPAAVVERLELQAAAKAKRAIERAQQRRRLDSDGLSPQTALTMRRLRIRELVQKAKGGR